MPVTSNTDVLRYKKDISYEKEKTVNIKLYTDMNAMNKNESGICHSFMIGLATAVNYISGEIDPVWLMGRSGVAFRIFVNEIMYPSAMSMFSFKDVIAKAVEQVDTDVFTCRECGTRPTLKKQKEKKRII